MRPGEKKNILNEMENLNINDQEECETDYKSV